MADKVAVSVIVPVYKAEKWIRDCAKSILDGSFSDLELILVDDGSPDGSGRICDELAGEDCRVRVIHQANAGVSTARNTGIREAAGEYIMFVDSDDTLDGDMLSVMYSAAKNENADMVLSGIRYVYEDSGRIVELPLPDAVIDFPEGMDEHYAAISRSYGLSACATKLIRRSIVEKNSISFNAEFFILEDGTFVSECLPHCGVIVSLSRIFYNYRKHEGESLMKRFNRNSVLSLANFLNKSRALICSLGEENRRLFFSQQFDLFWNFVTHIYSRSGLSGREKLSCLREYLSLGVAPEIACRAAAGTHSRRLQMFLVKHRCALLIHTILSLRS